MSKLVHGETIVLSPLIRRITAPNPGIMTGPGTNTYLVGTDAWAVIDPGPAIPEHVNAIVQAAADAHATIQWILCTHTHMDHSPAAVALQQATDALVIGMPANNPQSQDPSFSPDQCWQEGDYIQSDDFTLRAVHTPGHASNHLCFYLEQEQVLFTGDHIMEGSTVVIAPPDGDMKAYLDSLAKLKNLSLRHLAPAHGNRMEHPLDVIEGLIQHRLMREHKVLEGMAKTGPANLDTLTPAVYDDVPEFLHPIARFSLQAHLDKLLKEKIVSESDGIWQKI
ncbi:MBL fold metallo-hydrolase [Ketobacter sp.]|uniref:MBL fold metallo-hydrolase n=1 Tax=Ketobacter sp. TaxID=2083498 RepID=UPI000F11904F|nr:MBL fold metallo-hydrolase [Ketobacter sp.]RLU00229.1 MAG: MBL fold metallo-hydrolase [Ketobacter sp.]